MMEKSLGKLYILGPYLNTFWILSFATPQQRDESICTMYVSIYTLQTQGNATCDLTFDLTFSHNSLCHKLSPSL